MTVGEVAGGEIWDQLAPKGLLGRACDALPWGILVVSTEGRVLYYNRAYALLRRLPLGAWLGHSIEALERRRAVLELLRTGRAPAPPAVAQERRRHREIVFPMRHGDRLVGVVLVVLPAGLADATWRAAASASQPSRWRPQYTFADVVGCSAALMHLQEMACQAALSGSSVLLAGEPGVGKAMLAHAIHAGSHRQPFVPVDCRALPGELLHTVLFGAPASPSDSAGGEPQPSALELAGRGTVFLKGVDQMPLEAQGRLWRVLQERQLRRADGRSVPVACVVMASTTGDLEALAAQGQFCQKLLYRLGVLQLQVPPLRDRPEDIPLLVRHYWARLSGESGRSSLLSMAALRVLEGYSWPGNVRELLDVVERLAVPCNAPCRTPGAIAPKRRSCWVCRGRGWTTSSGPMGCSTPLARHLDGRGDLATPERSGRPPAHIRQADRRGGGLPPAVVEPIAAGGVPGAAVAHAGRPSPPRRSPSPGAGAAAPRSGPPVRRSRPHA
jgi:transcriptional regulator with PAS, ATPase and Fis domain